MESSEEGNKFMALAVGQAKLSLSGENFPVGTVLVIDGGLVGQERNSIKSDSNWTSHAELTLLSKHSSVIKQHVREKNSVVTMYTSLEPCLMCFGASVLNRISKIVYACPDPFTGATSVPLDSLSIGYKKIWPEIEDGLMRENLCKLVMEFMEKQGTDKWNKIGSPLLIVG